MDDYYNEKETERINSVPVHTELNSDNYTIKLCILFVLVTFMVVFFISRTENILEDEEQATKRAVEDEYRVSMAHNTYFYPMPAVPPPKYNEAMEAMLDPQPSSTIANYCPDKVDC